MRRAPAAVRPRPLLVRHLERGQKRGLGLPVVLFFLYTAAAVTTSRATLVVYLMIGDIYGTGMAWLNGLLTHKVLLRAALFGVPLYLGVWIGNRRFLATTPDSFRRFTVILLIFVSTAGLLRAAWHWAS